MSGVATHVLTFDRRMREAAVQSGLNMIDLQPAVINQPGYNSAGSSRFPIERELRNACFALILYVLTTAFNWSACSARSGAILRTPI
jgi:hypothetical protein